MKDDQITYVDKDGNEILCDILFTFHSDEFNKDYVLFYDASVDDDEEVQIMCASYIESEGSAGELNAVETDEEWDEIQKMLENFESDDSEAENEEDVTEDE
ncbi:MAG: DUF1292 domain-containing protein [Bacilli bacterium]